MPPQRLSEVIRRPRAGASELALMTRLVDRAQECSHDFDSHWLASMIRQLDGAAHVDAIKVVSAEIRRVGCPFLFIFLVQD